MITHLLIHIVHMAKEIIFSLTYLTSNVKMIIKMRPNNASYCLSYSFNSSILKIAMINYLILQKCFQRDVFNEEIVQSMNIVSV